MNLFQILVFIAPSLFLFPPSSNASEKQLESFVRNLQKQQSEITKTLSPDEFSCARGTAYLIRVSVTPSIQGKQRRNINEFSNQQQIRLFKAMDNFITPEVEDHHNHLSHEGDHFFEDHKKYILNLEEYLLQNGFEEFVPLPYWNPADSAPKSFLGMTKKYPEDQFLPETVNIQSIPKENKNLSEICRFQNFDEFNQDISTWHTRLHTGTGFTRAFRQPLFWLLHSYVIELYDPWKLCPKS